MVKEVKRVAAIHDMSGIGRCSLTAAIPIISVMGVQCCPFPTAILSCQTMYPEYSFFDFTDEMIKYEKVWQNLNAKFDCIYSGFLGSEKQIDIVLEFIDRHEESFVMIDPVMGDNRAIYKTYTDEMCSKMKKLVQKADLVTPNVTEALILTEKHLDHEVTIKEAELMAREICELGPKMIVITGIEQGDQICNLAYSKNTDQSFVIKKKYNKESYSGTGDIFSSILCGMLLNGHSLKEAVERASSFIYNVVNYTKSSGGNIKEGIMFEPFLKELI